MVTTSHIGDRPNLIKVQLEGLSTDKKPIKETSDGISIKMEARSHVLIHWMCFL